VTLPAVKGTGPAAAPTPAEEELPPLAELMPMPSATSPAAPAPAAAVSSAAPVMHEVAPAPREPRTSARTPMARRGHAQRVLFGGWFQDRPRARIVVGFLLALGLGSVAPAIHSRSVVGARIRPELQELVSARAYPALARLANFRSPEEIEESIAGIKSRSGVLAFVMWLLISGTLVFLWFRLV
jgi:hypothetical protein